MIGRFITSPKMSNINDSLRSVHPRSCVSWNTPQKKPYTITKSQVAKINGYTTQMILVKFIFQTLFVLKKNVSKYNFSNNTRDRKNVRKYPPFLVLDDVSFF